MAANDKQVAGKHYAAEVQHWDMVVMHKLNYFEGQITKYVMRARKKNGKQDLEKAMHFLEKYLEVYDQLQPPKPTPTLGGVWAPPYDPLANVAEAAASPQGKGYVAQG